VKESIIGDFTLENVYLSGTIKNCNFLYLLYNGPTS